MEDKTQQGNQIKDENQRMAEATNGQRGHPQGTTPRPLMEIPPPPPSVEIPTHFLERLKRATPSRPVKFNGMMFYQPPRNLDALQIQGPPGGQQGPYMAPRLMRVYDPVGQSTVIYYGHPHPGSNPGQSMVSSANPSSAGSSRRSSPDRRLIANPNEFQPGKRWISTADKSRIRAALIR